MDAVLISNKPDYGRRSLMSLNVSGKHMNVGDALTGRIEERVEEAVGKYFGNGYSGQVTLEKEGNWYDCDCVVHLDSGMVLQASAKSTDPTSSFEDAADKIEKRLRRYKRRLKDHHTNGIAKGGVLLSGGTPRPGRGNSGRLQSGHHCRNRQQR